MPPLPFSTRRLECFAGSVAVILMAEFGYAPAELAILRSTDRRFQPKHDAQFRPGWQGMDQMLAKINTFTRDNRRLTMVRVRVRGAFMPPLGWSLARDATHVVALYWTGNEDSSLVYDPANVIDCRDAESIVESICPIPHSEWQKLGMNLDRVTFYKIMKDSAAQA